MVKRSLFNKFNSQRGMTLTETLVTLVITSIGLMGHLGLQNKLHQSGQESYQRTQALLLANDIIDRLKTNRYSAPCYAFTTGDGAPYLGVSNSAGSSHAGTVACAGFGTDSTRDIASMDLATWDSMLQGISEIDEDGNLTGGVTGARGCIELDTTTVPSTYIVTVAWQGFMESATSNSSCAKGAFGSESLRRTVSTSVQLADLDA